MLTGVIPEAAGLYFAVDIDRSSAATISATGLHDSLCGARRRCCMELAERRVFQGTDWQPDEDVPRAFGSAAAPCRDMAETHAAHEADERLICALWWSGRLIAKVPPTAAVAAVFDALREWRCDPAVALDLVALEVDGFPPVVVARICEADGLDLCFGTAARSNWADAARAAVIEVFQMRFGLAVIRYRLAKGRPPTPREMEILRRAGGFRCTDMDALMPGAKPAPPTQKLTVQRQRHVERREGVWLAHCVVEMTSDRARAHPGPWSRWRLWP